MTIDRRLVGALRENQQKKEEPKKTGGATTALLKLDGGKIL